MPEPDPARPHTVGSALRELTPVLVRAGIEGAGGDLRRLVAAVLDLPSAALLSRPEQALSAEQFARLRCYVERRAKREPVSRILGVRDFYGRPFTISPATLDPRPDSETLIMAALAIAREEGWLSTPLRILDIGTGSGCLLLTLLCELPKASGMGTDISRAALVVARENANRFGVADRVDWLQADGLESIAGPFHMLVANPPYVRSAEMPLLEPEVRNFDPAQALDGGDDGLGLYRRLAPRIRNAIPNGWAVLEVGHDQADDVVALLASHAAGIDASEIRVHRDVAGKRRCVAVRTRD